MKLAYLELCGFRGYRNATRIDFADAFTIVDGRNGTGKSTIFDAIEFALTGTLSKYDDAKADGETVADYLWWTGEGSPPSERYVEVGFCADGKSVTIRRGQFEEPKEEVLAALSESLCDSRIAPTLPLRRLCDNSIIRDEHITSLSLDLKETERYALLRNALGASDADVWIARGATLVSLAKRRTGTAQQDVTAANSEVAAAAKRLDEVRASALTDTTVAESVERLREFASTTVAPDELAGPVREHMAAVTTEIESLRSLSANWATAETERSRIVDLTRAVDDATAERDAAAAVLQGLPEPSLIDVGTSLANDARQLISLVELGRKLGLQEGQCPLCMKGQSHEEFEHGMRAAETIARRLSQEAVRAAEREQQRRAAVAQLDVATRAVGSAEAARTSAIRVVDTFDRQREAQGVKSDTMLNDVNARIEKLRQTLAIAQRDLRILDTLKLNAELERTQRAEADARARMARAQERYGRALKAEAAAQGLHDAARRAASETLDLRLERVLPLMSELYRRLRPHPYWTDIEYSIRGDVRRFLKLQVGDELNPQFLFSSGQRRATGLAFLLSVNLSLAWSRWRTILLDDPVQHVDDFRTVHLAELAAQLVAEGRQIVCAVEDAALADLLCRRLPVGRLGEAKRITVGPDSDGAVALLVDRPVVPVVSNSLVGRSEYSAAG